MCFCPLSRLCEGSEACLMLFDNEERGVVYEFVWWRRDESVECLFESVLGERRSWVCFPLLLWAGVGRVSFASVAVAIILEFDIVGVWLSLLLLGFLKLRLR